MMKQTRLDALADGIFAIAMTLLVIEIKVPELQGIVTNAVLREALIEIIPLFLGYALSFVVLFTYWRGHHYIASVLAKNIDTKLTTINAIFFLCVALIPFSSLLLGVYNFTQTAIVFYGGNVIIIGLVLYWMRAYILNSPTIRNTETPPQQLRHGTIRILFPVFVAGCAIVISFFSTVLSLVLFLLAVLFNLSKRSTTLISSIMPKRAFTDTHAHAD